MNDLRRGIVWIAVLGLLAVGVWGFQRDEAAAKRPFTPENRELRRGHRVPLFGREYHLPLPRMACAGGAILCAAAALWPAATSERARRWLGRWERGGGMPGGRR